jgi:diphosphomevalonate decarboxylase
MHKSITYEAPSNIALVKYWGKYGEQLPRNPSISFTLDTCKTTTTLSLEEKTSNGLDVELYFDVKRNEAFEAKIKLFFEKILPQFPFLLHHKIVIHSSNTFPHSSGIASSASSMAALAMCLCSIDSDSVDIEKASNIARIGSGSACRSVYPKLALWGKNNFIPYSSNVHAIPFADEVDEIFHTYHNTILIASSGEKSVSSRAGHSLMESNRYAPERFAQANDNIIHLIGAMREGDLDTFGNIVEEEALTLHALMMTSTPSFILMKPATLSMIEKIRGFRNDTKIPVYFTLDAGPNIHLLYTDADSAKVNAFIQSDLVPLCENGIIIKDRVGNGPKRI